MFIKLKLTRDGSYVRVNPNAIGAFYGLHDFGDSNRPCKGSLLCLIAAVPTSSNELQVKETPDQIEALINSLRDLYVTRDNEATVQATAEATMKMAKEIQRLQQEASDLRGEAY